LTRRLPVQTESCPEAIDRNLAAILGFMGEAKTIFSVGHWRSHLLGNQNRKLGMRMVAAA
jgi:hypothetical protein